MESSFLSSLCSLDFNQSEHLQLNACCRLYPDEMIDHNHPTSSSVGLADDEKRDGEVGWFFHIVLVQIINIMNM